jgi:DNA (cytosine-5)-methyltransferase 1
MQCASFFAGVGGIDIGFELAGFKTIYANELDAAATETFQLNIPIKVDNRDINNVQCNEIPDFDIMLGGFPCQAFSIAGKGEGFNDSKGRGILFFELERIFKVKKPEIIFLENVKNLVSHDEGRTFNTILNILKDHNYHVSYKVLNASEYGGIPQNRERIYIVAFKNKSIHERFKFPEPIPLQKKITDMLEGDVDDALYYTEKTPFYSHLIDGMKDTNTVYQWRRKYLRANKSNVCPTLTANMGTGGHNVPLVLDKKGYRKLSPRECFNFQGFPMNFKLPKRKGRTQHYKQAGNSVCVTVIARIAANIKQAIIA